MIEEKQIVVSIRCFTYNHEPYIRQCLEGFVMQKTNFKFEAIVHDDASTDGTAAIIREYAEKYPDIIKPIYETENQYSKHDDSLGKIMNAHMRGKYIAKCEGDDYWIDPLKLQKQVDFMEANPEYGIIRTNINRFYQSSGIIEKAWFSSGVGLKMKDTYNDYIMCGWFAAPCTWLYRSEYSEELATFNEPNCFRGDIALLLTILRKSKIKYLDEVTAVYRILEVSASHFKTIEERFKFWVGVKNTRLYFAKDLGPFLRLKLRWSLFVYSLRIIGRKGMKSLLCKCVSESCFKG